MVSMHFSNVGCVPECCQSVFFYADGVGGCSLRWTEYVLCIFQLPESRCPMAFMEIAAECFSFFFFFPSSFLTTFSFTLADSVGHQVLADPGMKFV